MVKPVYKIEIWEPGGGSALYSITDEVISLRCKATATSNIGNFSFVLPARKGVTEKYEDIDLYDTVKIFLDYNTIPATAIFQGHIEVITGLLTEQGYMRQFVGSDRGEILARRLKRNYRWNNRQASNLVTDLANDLSLGTGDIAADAAQEKITIDEAPYLEVLQKASDYWVSGGSQVKKDFFVDIANDLNWKARPIRTANVETFTIGDNVIAYKVQRSVQQIFNNIWVFGAYGKQDDADTYTEATTNWTAGAGCTMGTDAGHKATGTVAVTSTADLSTFINDFYYSFASTIERYNTFTMNWDHSAYVVSSRKIRLCCEDLSNYFEADIPSHTPGSFEQVSFDLGPSEEYDATDNPEGIWTINGHTHWNNINYVRFLITSGTAGIVVWMDGDWGFKDGAYRSTASDATSQTNYGQRDLLIEDQHLANDTECQSRAEALLYQHKDPPIQLEMLVKGNTNVLVGDRLSITIPEESLSSQNFEVFSVEHMLDVPNGFRTRFLATDSINVRNELPSSSTQALLKTIVTHISSIHQNVRSVK